MGPAGGPAIDPVSRTRHYLDRIAALNPALIAFVWVEADGACDAAQRSAARWRDGAPLSPLDGMAFAIKANIAVQGLPWHAGIAAYRDRIAPADAACIARLRQGGAVLLGMTNMDEGALGGVTDNAAFGRTQNPWRADYTAGGSSGGAAAAVAAGLCDLAMGTDTIGSVRIPASYCGVIGHKFAAGAVSLEGVIPLAPALDQLGILGRDPALVADACAWLRGPAPSPADGGGPIAVLDLSAQVAISPEVAAALESAAAQLGAITTLRLPDHDVAALRRAAWTVLQADAALVHAAALDRPDGCSPRFRTALLWAAAQPPARIEAARTALAQAGAALRTQLAPYRAVLAPTTPHTAFNSLDPPPPTQADLTALASLAGLAATAVPMGLDTHGLPLSLQIIAPTDAPCLTLAARLGQRLACGGLGVV